VKGTSELLEAKMPVLCTVAQVARCLALSRSGIYAMMNAGQLPFVKIGRSRRIRLGDVLTLVNSNVTGGKDVAHDSHLFD
jgi:excisionase family DNA binding protein